MGLTSSKPLQVSACCGGEDHCKVEESNDKEFSGEEFDIID